jgi:Bacterial nucleoid DNA-binding protein
VLLNREGDMSETLTRAGLAELIYSEIGISKTEASDVVDQFFEEIILDLIDGNSVKLTSFGTFSVNYKKERIGRNPKTKEEAIIDARRVISFRASKELKRRVNKQNIYE